MTHLNKKLLVSLLDLAQSDVPASVAALANHVGMTRREVAGGLDELAVVGLVRADTVRLTFLGLMKASGLRARARQRDVAA